MKADQAAAPISVAASSGAKAAAPATVANAKLETAELLFLRAEAMGLQPAWVTPKGVIALRFGEHESYLNYARSPLNTQTSASLCSNKYYTRMILQRRGLDNIPFTRARTFSDATTFWQTHGKIIAKPLKGSGSADIHIITEATQLQNLNIRGYILEKYIAGEEVRFLVLNDEVIAVHISHYGESVEYDRALLRISIPSQDWDAGLVTKSRQIATILGLRFAAVDFLVDAAGKAHILEINSNPGLKWFHAPSSGPVVNVAHLFLDSITAQHSTDGA